MEHVGKTTPLAVVILAAGKGTRMKSQLPKVMHEIAGLAMLGHVVKTAEALSPEKIVIVAAPDHVGAFSAAFDAHEIAVQTEQLGTGHALRCAETALKNFTGNVLVLYGDVPLVRAETLQKLLAKKQNATVSVLGFRAANPFGYGRLIATADRLMAIVEEKDASADEKENNICNSGLMAVSAPRLWELLAQLKNDNQQKEYYLTDIAKASGDACFALAEEAEVMGVNDRMQLAAAEALYQKNEREAFMRAGVTLRQPETVIFSHDTQIAPDVIIGANVVFGPGVVIESGAEIFPFSHLVGCTIKSGAHIGPFARVRPTTIIGEYAVIGNFVEIKNSQFANKSKAKHLSYIGDTSVGMKANIGAGTIVCNYDGVGKYKTEIGAGAFIGSNTTLVSPIAIGEGAMTGAGSVITKDIPAGALAIARTVQKNIEGWATNFFAKGKK